MFIALKTGSDKNAARFMTYVHVGNAFT